MESSGSSDDDDDEEDYETLLYSIVHHSMVGLPGEKNIRVQPGSSHKIMALYHRVERNVSPQPTTSYCRVEEQKVCHSGTLRSSAGDIDIQPHNKKTSTSTTEVRSMRTQHLTSGKNSSKEQHRVDVITIESSDTECESRVEVSESGDSDVQPYNDETDTLARSVRNKRRFQHLNMGRKGSEQECVINVDDSDTECESVSEVESVPTVSAGSHRADGNMRKEGSCMLKTPCTKGEYARTKKKKQNKGAEDTRNLKDISDYVSPKSWTPEMRHFYSESWGGENFDIGELQKTMSDNPADWRVLDIDFVPHTRRRRSDRKGKCYNCNSFGHVVMSCPHPQKPIVCIFCGVRGHHKWKCPTSICLSCGEPSKVYRGCCDKCVIMNLCSNCNMVRHPHTLCPEMWRMYHSVTSSEGESAALSETLYKPQKDQWCPMCAQRGHQFRECPLLTKKFYTQTELHKPLKRKLEIPEKKKKKKKNTKTNFHSVVSTVLL